jgi:hypothetical protein
MDFTDTITNLGIPTIVVGLLYIGRKLQILDDMQITMNKVKTNVKVISDYLTRTHDDFDHAELHDYSPLRLSARGKKLIYDLGFDKVFEQQANEFFQHIDREDPKLKYDVEVAAIKSISTLADRDYMSFLKVFFYNNPSRNLQNTGPTLGIYIRDKYLAEHPDITE